MRRTLVLAVAAVLLGPAAAPAQVERYELGRRLKAFEVEWEKADAAGRKRAAALLKDVHQYFFSFRFGEAGRVLDLATHALHGEKPPAVEDQWLASLMAVPEARVVDAAAKDVGVTVKPFYPVKGDRPNGLAVEAFSHPDYRTPRAEVVTFPVVLRPRFDPGAPRARGADVPVVWSAGAPGFRERTRAVTVSRVEKAAERVAKLKAAAEGWPALDTVEQATARDRAGLLADLLDGTVHETDVPAAALLEEAERMLDGRPVVTAERAGSNWLSVPLGGKKTAAVRVRVPAKLDPATPVPVVVGLHGAGGSENLFFEGYGAGKFVDECEKRGWVFVATRSGLAFGSAPPVVEILEQLAKRYPIDMKRVYLVGHSMGAGHAVLLAQKHPGKFAGVAALAGGGVVTDPKAFAGLPVLVATGSDDFGRSGAVSLNKTLAAAGAKVVFKDYPDREHLLVARESVPDVYALFDAGAGK